MDFHRFPLIFIDFRWFSCSFDQNAWQPVAACCSLWRPVAADWIPYTNLYLILAGWRLPKLDDLKVAGILAAGWLLASWLRMLMNVNGDWWMLNDEWWTEGWMEGRPTRSSLGSSADILNQVYTHICALFVSFADAPSPMLICSCTNLLGYQSLEPLAIKGNLQGRSLHFIGQWKVK